MAYLLPIGETDINRVLSGTTIAASLNLASILIQGGGQQVVSNLDQSGLSSGLTMVDIQPGSSVGIGSASGGALKATIKTMLRAKGSGGLIKLTPITTGASSVARLLNLGGNNFSLVSGSTAPVVLLEQSGAGTRIDIDDSTRVTTLTMTAGAIDQQYNSTQNTTWHISGGSLTTGRGWSGTARVGGSANIVVGRQDNNITSLPTGATLEMGGGSMTWRGGNLTAAYVSGGFLDFRYVPAAMTIGTLVVSADVVRRSYFKSIGATNLVTISSLTIYGGDLDTVLQ